MGQERLSSMPELRFQGQKMSRRSFIIGSTALGLKLSADAIFPQRVEAAPKASKEKTIRFSRLLSTSLRFSRDPEETSVAKVEIIRDEARWKEVAKNLYGRLRVPKINFNKKERPAVIMDMVRRDTGFRVKVTKVVNGAKEILFKGLSFRPNGRVYGPALSTPVEVIKLTGDIPEKPVRVEVEDVRRSLITKRKKRKRR